MKLLVINSAPYNEKFVAPIIRCLTSAGIESGLVAYENIPADLSSYGGVIISASPRGDDIVETHIPYYQWIRNFSKPILGICHGHQVIGVIHGADLIRDTQSENGLYLVNKEEDSPLFTGLDTNFKVEQHHKDSITLPDKFRLLASSKKCRVQAMVHQAKPIYTIQFHAEKKPKIILNFVSIAKGNNP
jgi:GMP synthase (glutamine-hydrolysing)